MNIARMFAAAALVAASLGVSGAANAQTYGGARYGHQDQRGGYQDRRDESDRDARDNRQHERGYDRRDERGQNRNYGYDAPSYGSHDRGHGWDQRNRRCKTEWRHHHAVTRCW
jgi:hypothetical protein